MRRQNLLLAAAFAAALIQPLAQPFASAQLLKKLEQRLGGALDKLNQPADPLANPAPVAQPGYLGMTADETDGQQGIVVLGVKPGSPAEAAKLQKGDLVSAINGQAVKNLDDFEAVLNQVAAGQKATFTVLRGQQALTLNATLVARQTPPVNRANQEDPGPPPDAAPGFNPAAPPAVPEVGNARGSLGISVVQLTEQARTANGLTASRGALVAAVKVGGPAERAGIPVGSLIVAVDGQRVNTPDEVVELVAAARAGQEMELSYYRGATLTRKTVRLAPAALDARAQPAGNPAGGNVAVGGGALGGILGGAGGDRPIVRRVGEVIDGLARPAGGQPVGLGEEVNALKSQVELLQATIRSLEDRINRLEGRAPANEAAPALPPGDDPVKRLELKLTPPEKPALPTPPALP
ncbi:PDZ domain-containing protein [Anatilimnocola floriformis]|uniref:PDZ domain-containing protein n=1 Tax=Anatilimnocola floriformis TaxID=2948575 RepID=UPI0020C536AF|nr:PDZ domain-containing protein [Anatilimnocola floriformis]